MNRRHTLAGLLTIGLLLSAAPARAAASVPALANASWDWEQAAHTERFSKTVPIGKTGSVVLTNIAGDIVVTGGGGDQVVIEAIKRGRTAEALKEVEIEVIASEGRVEITTKYPRGTRSRDGRGQASVSYTLTLPRGVALRVKSISGDIGVSTIDGMLRVDTISGDVRLTQVTQIEAARSVSGDVTVKSASASGTLDIGSVSGDVDLTGVKARAVDISSVSGDVELADVTCDRLTAKSVSGGLTFSGPLAKTGRYALQSHSGNVRVRILNDVGFEVNAASFSGDIKSDLPLTVRSAGASNERRRRQQEIRGTYGDASATLELNSFSGDIHITGRDTTPAKK